MYDVTVGDGQYRLLFDKLGLRALRYGSEWRNLAGDNLVLSLVQEVDELRKKVEQLNDETALLQSKS